MGENAVDMGAWNEFYSAELSAEIINEYSEELQAMDHPEEILNFSLFKNKFAVFNYIRVVKRIGYPKNSVFIEDLMKGLQDANWPFFNELLELFKSAYPEELLVKTIDEFLVVADDEGDYMWISGLAMLIDYLGADIERFRNKKILGKREF